MNYGLKKPCAKCPFRSDIRPFLTAERVEEIAYSLQAGAPFPCHATVDYSKVDEDGDHEYAPTSREQFCAGALILMEKEFSENGGCLRNQAVRWETRLGGDFNPDNLDLTAPVFDSFDEMIEAQEE